MIWNFAGMIGSNGSANLPIAEFNPIEQEIFP
jgi:hypothetical protein